MRRVAITSGDTDGIGLEVSSKSLNSLGPLKDVQFVLFRDKNCPKKYLDLLKKKFKIHSCDLDGLPRSPKSSSVIIDIASSSSPAHWVREAALLCKNGRLQSMVTAPLSKIEIKKAGLKATGHTEILGQVCNKKLLFMTFVGKKFNVLLATGHIPTSQVNDALTKKVLRAAIQEALNFRNSIGNKKPIGVLALNPHAGEKNIIGNEEEKVFAPVLKKFLGLAEGPLVPDVAFFEENWKKYSIYVASYHDQGLIPFKSIHGREGGVHMTLGIPFLRTSVDHGTAKDIAHKDKADFQSMKKAIELNVKILKKRGYS